MISSQKLTQNHLILEENGIEILKEKKFASGYVTSISI